MCKYLTINWLSHLKVSQLEGGRGHSDDVRRLLEGLAALLLPLGGDHLGPGLPGGLSLGGHGPLQLLGQPHILDLHPVHMNSPGIGRLLL